MIKEALAYIATLKDQQHRYVELDLPEHFTKYITGPDGETITLETPVEARDHATEDFDSFVRAIQKYGSDVAIWVSGSVVTAVFDDDGRRRESIRLNLRSSHGWNSLRNELPATLGQKELVRWLKRNFSLDTPLIAAIRKVDFARSSSGSKTVEHGRESLGRSVEAAVQNATDIPASTVVQLSRYSNRRLRDSYPLELRVDIDVENEQFWIGPAPDEVVLLQQKASSAIIDLLVKELDANDNSQIFVGERD